MSDTDRASAREELRAVFDAADDVHAPLSEGLLAVAIHVLRDPLKWRALLDVPYPDAPSASVSGTPARTGYVTRFGDGEE